jgi:hypothetical protein
MGIVYRLLILLFDVDVMTETETVYMLHQYYAASLLHVVVASLLEWKIYHRLQLKSLV